MPLNTSKSLSIVLGASACGLSGYLLYLLYQQWKNDDDKEYSSNGISTNNFTRTEIKVPTEYVRVILGRNGANIKQLEKETNTRIHFKHSVPKQDVCYCEIRGSAPNVGYAEHMIQGIIYKQPAIECETVWVPQKTVGKIIGRCGENITHMCAMSGANIQVSDDDRRGLQRKITVKGTKDQVALAKCYIEEVVENFQNVGATLTMREPRMRAKKAAGGDTNKLLESPKVEQLATVPGQTDSPFEVYISAMIDPSRFWLQIVGPKAKELDLLVEEMTEYYRSAESLENHKLTSVTVGDLVAATFQYDNKWYRAEVLNLGNESQAELYYVDYGDTDTVSIGDLYELRTDFLRLNFQAIECFLSRIEPLGDAWSEEAVDKFEEWTHVAQWQRLSAKVNEYSVREKTRAKREGSPVPGVDLFDVGNETDVDIAQELVRQGYAVYKKDATRSNSRATSIVSNESTSAEICL